jgi:signal peptidase I
MQCSNCQFENMPGVKACGRCGASLELATLTIDVHPPRASRAARTFRRWVPFARYWNRFRGSRGLAGIGISGWPEELQRPGILLRMIVPGWPHRALGRWQRGRRILMAYLAMLLLGLLYAGTWWGFWLIGFSIAIHVASILDIAAATVPSYRVRIAYAAGAMLILIPLIYYPAGWLIGQVAWPQQFAVPMPPFQAGDVVLENPSAYRWSDPQPGQVVHYMAGARNARGTFVFPAVYHVPGDRFDRVIARGGQVVTTENGRVLVDGQPSPWLPLNPALMPNGIHVTVPEQCYLIFPTTNPVIPGIAAIPQANLDAWQNNGIVSRAQIRARVYLQLHPLWRFGFLR